MNKTEQVYDIRFPKGLLGFEDVTAYTLRRPDSGPVWELRPQKGDYPQFVLFEAASVADGYAPELPKDVLGTLAVEDCRELSYFAIAVVPADVSKTTVNLRSPVAVNFKEGLAVQAVLEGGGYPMRHPIFSEAGR